MLLLKNFQFFYLASFKIFEILFVPEHSRDFASSHFTFHSGKGTQLHLINISFGR